MTAFTLSCLVRFWRASVAVLTVAMAWALVAVL